MHSVSAARIVLRLVLVGGLVGVGWSALRTLDHNRVQAERIDAAYDFAAGNPGVLEYIPCFCGCGTSLLHTSVESCFIDSRSESNRLDVVYDEHGATCRECVDIVHDVRERRGERQSLAEIRRIIEETYGFPDRERWTQTPEAPPAGGVGPLSR